MIDIEKVKEALREVCLSSHCVSETLRKDLKPFEVTERKNIIYEAISELERLRTFKATFDRYELSQKQDYVAYEIMEELQKERREMKAKVKRYFELVPHRITTGEFGFDFNVENKLDGEREYQANERHKNEFSNLKQDLIEWSEENE